MISILRKLEICFIFVQPNILKLYEKIAAYFDACIKYYILWNISTFKLFIFTHILRQNGRWRYKKADNE